MISITTWGRYVKPYSFEYVTSAALLCNPPIDPSDVRCGWADCNSPLRWSALRRALIAIDANAAEVAPSGARKAGGLRRLLLRLDRRGRCRVGHDVHPAFFQQLIGWGFQRIDACLNLGHCIMSIT